MTSQSTAIHPATHIGRVTLTVQNLEAQTAFYQRVIGLTVLKRDERRVVLGAESGKPLLVLEGDATAPRRPGFSTGLYHFAILVPTRVALGQALARLPRNNYPLGGYADHLVSEALYLTDPEGNGIELYRDRPRDTWTWQNGQVKMANRPIDLQQLISEGEHEGGPAEKLPEGTVIGHIHLQVSSIAEAERFYHQILGFEIVARMPSALFISAGGYHHHIGLNTWDTAGAPPTPAGSTGLRLYEIAVPDEQGRAAVRESLRAAGVPFEETVAGLTFTDPFGNHIVLS